jgi:hypothetical protein
LFIRLVALLGGTLRRFALLRDQIHFLGNYSLAIITVSGLFVGFVLSLQGYYTLQRYGSSEALGLLVALSLVRELGPVVTALLFAGRAGTSLTAEIGLMKAGEQLSAMEMMAVDPVRRILAPRFWGGVIAMPLLAAVFSAVGILGGWAVGDIRATPPTRRNQIGARRWRQQPPAGLTRQPLLDAIAPRMPWLRSGSARQAKQASPYAQFFLAALDLLRWARVVANPSKPLALISCANWLR